jgi:hypothetical protein
VKAKVVGILCVVFLALLGGTAGAGTAPSASVENTATVVSQVGVVFEFDLYNCPAGSDIGILDWTANQPDRADSGAASGLQFYGVSNGDQDQRLVLEASQSGFLPGEQWVGSGDVICGALVIPVTGSGQTKSLSGV